jgi:hypothetical protein
MARALLVAHENVLDVVLLEELVIDRKHGAARIAEQMLDAIVLQRLHDHLGAGHLAIGTRREKNAVAGRPEREAIARLHMMHVVAFRKIEAALDQPDLLADEDVT